MDNSPREYGALKQADAAIRKAAVSPTVIAPSDIKPGAQMSGAQRRHAERDFVSSVTPPETTPPPLTAAQKLEKGQFKGNFDAFSKPAPTRGGRPGGNRPSSGLTPR